MRTSSRSSPKRIHHGLIWSPQIHNGRGPYPVPVHQNVPATLRELGRCFDGSGRPHVGVHLPKPNARSTAEPSSGRTWTTCTSGSNHTWHWAPPEPSTCRGASAETQRTLDSGAKLWAYLDDLYIWIKPHLALGATNHILQFILSETHRMLESVAKLLGFSWTSGTSGSARITSQPSTWPRAPPAPSTSNCSPARSRSGQSRTPAPFHPPS